ncbi:cytochrome b/b6 domain-containing protein, partial [Xanthomonas citri pv. citri]|nr:cytochrome b/b6 domain-containing protein [Xanthomonas citri pv. citri]
SDLVPLAERRRMAGDVPFAREGEWFTELAAVGAPTAPETVAQEVVAPEPVVAEPAAAAPAAEPAPTAPDTRSAPPASAAQ